MPTQQTWTTRHPNGPDHLGLCNAGVYCYPEVNVTLKLFPVCLAVGETSVILLTSPLHHDWNAYHRERGVQQNDSLADG